MSEDDRDLLDVLELITAGKQPERDELICIAGIARERLQTLLETCRKINALAGEESLRDVFGVMVQGLLGGVMMEVHDASHSV